VGISSKRSPRTQNLLPTYEYCNTLSRYRAALSQRPGDVDIAANLLSQEMLARGAKGCERQWKSVTFCPGLRLGPL
jgi:hypothetical protein